MTDRGRLQDKVAIVVGAGQSPGETIGNGRATALLFAREGAKLFLVDIDGPSIEETRRMIAGEGGIANVFEADITREDQCKAFARECLRIYGRIDILHNSAGINGGDNEITLLSEQAWDRIMGINLKGMFFCCKHVLPAMQRQSAGAIVNVSSTGALWSGEPYVAYNTSKAGVNGLTKAMVIDCARHGVRVNAIMPGLINTPMGVDAQALEKNLDRNDLVRSRNEAIPLCGKMGEAWDVAHAALFLASDEARFITGAILPVDGGQLLNRSCHLNGMNQKA